MRVSSVARSLVRRAAPSDGSGARPSFVGERGELGLGVLRVVARPLRPDLAAGDLLAALLEAGVDARLLGGALAQLGGELLAGGAVGGELGLERLDAGARSRPAAASSAFASRSATGLQRLVALEPAALVLEPARALRALALGALGEPLLGRDRATRPGRLRSALGPSSGAARRCWMTQRACRSASAASSRARAAARASRSIASRAASASATVGLGRLDLGLGGRARPARRPRPA